MLDLLPDYWSIDMLRGFLTGALQRSVQRHREGKIVLGLSRGENIMVHVSFYNVSLTVSSVITEKPGNCAFIYCDLIF